MNSSMGVGDDGPHITIGALLDQTSNALGNRHEARWVCEVATALDGAELDASLGELATVKMVSHLDDMVARIRGGEPLQYVLGRWGFRTLDLAVDRRVLIPRPETELVAEVAIDLARACTPRTLVDLGTGSGAIGLSAAAELPIDGTTVWLTDVDSDALEVANANLAGLGRAGVNVRTALGSWFDALPAGFSADVIVSNPPYVAINSPLLDAPVAKWEPATALFSGVDGLDDIRALVAKAPDHLTADGWLVLEIGSDQGAVVSDLFRRYRYRSIEIRADLAGHDRVAVGRCPVD